MDARGQSNPRQSGMPVQHCGLVAACFAIVDSLLGGKGNGSGVPGRTWSDRTLWTTTTLRNVSVWKYVDRCSTQNQCAPIGALPTMSTKQAAAAAAAAAVKSRQAAH
ncbi:hypothetical protein B0A54_07443 [Friedmanniomyces endolithicus]|uniref:Uncharacterized protein n=1 Tax=Friedmanniomyces endolithicus TaxID=329885 RepID=A0A4U0V1W1_9PEZI|nr:hypothetical protein B0A54_07443 [Friedmanniomyces endolithicus]